MHGMKALIAAKVFSRVDDPDMLTIVAKPCMKHAERSTEESGEFHIVDHDLSLANKGVRSARCRNANKPKSRQG